MATAAQITANQANAQHSTGPRTPEGKARVAGNAVKHGLTARHLELLHAAWNLHRFRRIEAECSLGTLDDFTDPQTTAVLDRLTRYQARAQRAYYRALQELRTLQTNRALRQIKLAEEDEAEVPAITDINNLTKQSRSEVTAAAIEQAVNMINYETGVLHLKAVENRLGVTSSR